MSSTTPSKPVPSSTVRAGLRAAFTPHFQQLLSVTAANWNLALPRLLQAFADGYGNEAGTSNDAQPRDTSTSKTAAASEETAPVQVSRFSDGWALPALVLRPNNQAGAAASEAIHTQRKRSFAEVSRSLFGTQPLFAQR